MNTDGDNSHESCVNDWIDRVVGGLPPERVIPAFEQAFDSLWRRAHQTLGEVTLTAIVDRIVHTAVDQHPILAPLQIGGDGLQWQELRERSSSIPESQLIDALRFVLVDFLTVIGNLTAEILTPSLHAALSTVKS